MPYFSKLSKSEFEKQIVEVGDVTEWFEDKVSEMDLGEFPKEKKHFLIKSICFDIDPRDFCDKVNKNTINWNAGDDPKLNEIASGFKEQSNNSIEEIFYKLIEAYLDDPALADTLNNVLENLSPKQIWAKRETIKKVLIGARLIGANLDDKALNTEDEDIIEAQAELMRVMDPKSKKAAPVYQDINKVDDAADAGNPKKDEGSVAGEPLKAGAEDIKQEVPVDPNAPLTVEDPKGAFTVTRIRNLGENAKQNLITKLSSNDVSDEEKRNEFLSYIFRNLSDKEFTAKVKAVCDTESMRRLVARVIEPRPADSVSYLLSGDFESWITDTLLQNMNSQINGMNAHRRLDIVDKKIADEKAAAAKAKEEKDREDALIAKTRKKLEDAEATSPDNLVDAIFSVKKKIARSSTNPERIIENSVTDEYINNIMKDPQKADSLYQAFASYKVDLYANIGEMRENKNTELAKQAENQTDAYHEIKDDREMIDAVASKAVFNKISVSINVAGIEAMEKSFPDKKKLGGCVKKHIDELKQREADKDHEKLYTQGLSLKKTARIASQRFGFKGPQLAGVNPPVTERTKEVVGARKGEGAMKLYDAALKRFNTQRWSVFRKESRTHALVREAAESFLAIRKEYGVKHGVAGIMEDIKDPEDRRELAVRYLEAAQDLHHHARFYVHDKNPMTFAGADRYGGAKDLRAISKKDVAVTEAAIKKFGGEDFSLTDIYAEVAARKHNAAEKCVSGMDFSQPVAPKNGRSIDDQITDRKKVLLDAICDVLASHYSETAIRNDPESVADNNYYKIREKMNESVQLVVAVDQYLSQNMNKDTILADMKNKGKGLIDKLAQAHNLDVEKIAKPSAPKANNNPISI